MKYIMSLDQGTTSSRALLIDKNVNIASIAQAEFTQYYPKEQWVEHDPNEIWVCQRNMIEQVLLNKHINLDSVAAIGITNQRETTVLWDKNTGEPIYNAIVWQCRRTSTICYELHQKGYDSLFKKKTGLPIDAYFSGTKIRWILDHVEGAKEKAQKGEILFGTIDTWLIWKMTNGRVHVTDKTNASRTLLYNIHTQEWDDELLNILSIPKSMLPEVKSSSEIYGYTDKKEFGFEVPISGIAGDQQAALFGQMCTQKGDVKNTYGTGCFLLMNTGTKPIESKNGLLTTIALDYKGEVTYALEGSIFMAGAIIQWLRDNLGIIQSAPECNVLAEEVDDCGGVYFVPAFQGLGAPYWNMDARASIKGITRSTTKHHICRAALESIVYRSLDIINIMEKDSGIPLRRIKVDGGAARSDLMLQFQSDMSGADVIRPQSIETTALGAAFLAGLSSGFWESTEEISSSWKIEKTFKPHFDIEKREKAYKLWIKAVEHTLSRTKQ